MIGYARCILEKQGWNEIKTRHYSKIQIITLLKEYIYSSMKIQQYVSELNAIIPTVMGPFGLDCNW